MVSSTDRCRWPVVGVMCVVDAFTIFAPVRSMFTGISCPDRNCSPLVGETIFTTAGLLGRGLAADVPVVEPVGVGPSLVPPPHAAATSAVTAIVHATMGRLHRSAFKVMVPLLMGSPVGNTRCTP